MGNFVCLECGKKFKTVKAAQRATDNGCPKCGGVDIDLKPVGGVAEYHQKRIAEQNKNMPDLIRAVMGGD